MRATIVQLQGDEAAVQTTSGAGCGSCSSEGGCGSSKLTQLFCSKQPLFFVHNEIGAKVGDEVEVELPDGVLLRSSMQMYVLPLLLLLAGGLFGTMLTHDSSSRDVYAVSGSMFGLLSGFVLAKLHSSGIGKPVVRSIIVSHPRS